MSPPTKISTDGTNVTTYTYGSDIWGDLLLAYNGTAIQYDGSGNPCVHGSTRYTWEHGRQLASMTKNGVTWNYTYNNAGLRTGRTNGSTTYSYVYNGSQLVRMVKDGEIIDFTYDASGTPLTMKVGNTTYYYITNLQGDVVALVNESGATVVSYSYTAYGIVSITEGENTTAAALNPLTYRGYVYDPETGLYYLQSRYYDPTLGRFINADGLVSTGQGFTGNNMFAYCLNNPVIMADFSGYDAIIVVDENRVGHTGILVQDEDGTWHHFYWGSAHSGSSNSGSNNGSSFSIGNFFRNFTRKTKTSSGSNNGTNTWCREYTGEATLDAINESKQYSGSYEDMIYLEGDFSDCVSLMENAEDEYGKYNLFNQNCTQTSLAILASVKSTYQSALAAAAKIMRPKKAFEYLEENI